ncbi:MAG TPA: hypothetical protein VM491_23475, partial [Burkholderiaceae bacterium]|nr:hypothetical protein [Burkholderiaceae bacterium]
RGGSGPSGGSGPLVQGGQGVVPPAGGTTGPACDPPICREMQVRNCESLGTAIGNCMQAGAGLPSCGRSKFTLAEVKAACYDNMVRRCQQGTSQVAQKLTPGNWCAQRGADPSCEVRAQRVCGCNPKTHPACRGKWEE